MEFYTVVINTFILASSDRIVPAQNFYVDDLIHNVIVLGEDEGGNEV